MNKFFILLFVLVFSTQSHAIDLFKNNVLLDILDRQKLLQTPEYAKIKNACLASKDNIKQPTKDMPKPVLGLKATDGYGSDKSLSHLSWYLMIHSGRAMAGDVTSQSLVKNALLAWSKANALSKTEVKHDAYYALKRGLLPIINSYFIVENSLSKSEQTQIKNWIDPLVRRVDHKFGGDVDHNNHRYLGDSVLTLWGDVVDDKELYSKGRERFEIAINDMRVDGSLPLETRRGSRALWYMRQSLANLTFIAEIYAQNGDDLYSYTKDGKSLSTMMNYFVAGARNPLVVMADASENYIPGPSNDFLNQDMGTFERRGGKRHYMAFAHIYEQGQNNLSSQRLSQFMNETGYKKRPLIDDYIGGNATCLWGRP